MSARLTFLPLMEDGRTGVVNAVLVVILIRLAAAFVYAFLRHVYGVFWARIKVFWGWIGFAVAIARLSIYYVVPVDLSRR